jgi:hypothetical protein
VYKCVQRFYLFSFHLLVLVSLLHVPPPDGRVGQLTQEVEGGATASAHNDEDGALKEMQHSILAPEMELQKLQ